MEFTKDQQNAISHRDGNLQLIACAGSGKTEVVARRVVTLLDPEHEPRVFPANLVAFTFTDKAAAELKHRIIERVRERYGNMQGLAEMFVGTIHAFCLDLLKSEVPKYLKYEVLNEVQQALLVDRHCKQSGLTTTLDLKGKPLQRYKDTDHYVKALAILREAELVETELADASIVEGLNKYREVLEGKNALDYSAIMERAVRAIAESADLRHRLSERIQHVIVDEYQDVNPIQEALVRLLSSLGAGICVVGDDDQTIYQWRGSNVENILTFEDRYAPVESVRLQENFRSSRGIVETARDFISQNTERLPKEMVPTEAQPFEPGDIVALPFNDPEQESTYIAETIQSLLGTEFRDGEEGSRGLAYADMAVLLRSVKHDAEAIANALDKAGIPYVVGGMNRLFETAEAKAARHLFYFLANRSDITAPDLVGVWLDAELGLAHESVQAAVEKVDAVRHQVATHPDDEKWAYYNLQRQFLTFLEDSGLSESNVPNERGELVFYNLGKFSQIISDFETINWHSDPQRKYNDFANFLQYRAETTYPEGWQDHQYSTPNAVQIMTVHQAKGMQWPAVFVPALLKNRFPAPGMGGKSVWHILPEAGVRNQARYLGGLEDERRLFYVAMTRSQKFLHMTWGPIEGKNNRYRKPSVFWEDVLVSKHVKRRRQDYSVRPKLPPKPRSAVANVTLSFSDLKYFFECPYQFKLRILYGFNPPIHEALGYGKSLHDALAEVHSRAIRGDIPDTTEAERLARTHLHVPYAYASLRETLQENAGRVLSDYLTDNAADFANIEFSEKTVEIDLGAGVTVAGRIDLVRRKDTDETTIIDLKSTDRAQAEEVTETQLHIYALGYRELTGRNADFVEIYNLDERKKRPRSVDEDFITDVQRDVKHAANALRKNELPAKPYKPACASCDYKGLCPHGDTVSA